MPSIVLSKPRKHQNNALHLPECWVKGCRPPPLGSFRRASRLDWGLMLHLLCRGIFCQSCCCRLCQRWALGGGQGWHLDCSTRLHLQHQRQRRWWLEAGVDTDRDSQTDDQRGRAVVSETMDLKKGIHDIHGRIWHDFEFLINLNCRIVRHSRALCTRL